MAVMLKDGGQHMQWYQDELLHMARDLGLRLLPAFNTSSGLPYPRVRQSNTKIPQLCHLMSEINPTSSKVSLRWQSSAYFQLVFTLIPYF